MTQVRKWAVGSTMRGTVLTTIWAFDIPVQVVDTQHGDTHLLIGESCVDLEAVAGEPGVLTFCAGGPMGGHWRFRRAAVDPAA